MKLLESPQKTGGFPKTGAKPMQTTTAHPTASVFRLNKPYLVAMLLFLIVASAVFVFISLNTSSSSSNLAPISQNTLEVKYGLRVSLVAVTAAGGMVDVRLKIVDGGKAKLLLQDKKNFPVLSVNNGNLTLRASEETKSQVIKFENDGNLFLLFPNAGNAVKPGAAVSLLFGDTVLEPIDAR
jgi:hypothetical protein